ncbi:SPT2 chromatin protein [Ditylenchus destructor]|nr:SPT2 chromatin protein [Ditylenchus destructor]
MRYGRGDSEQLDRLVKDKEREEEQQEKLNALYRTGAFKAKNTLLEKNPNASSSKDSINRTPQIQRPSSSSKKISPNSSIPSSSKAFSSQPRPNHSKPIEKKRKIPEAEDFSLLMRKAEQNRSIDPSAAEDFFPDPPPTKQPKSTKQDELGVTAGRSLTYNTARAAAKKDKDEREKREELYRKEVLAKERVLANGGPITKPKPVASSLNSTKPSMDRSKFSATSSRVTASSASSKKDVRTNSKPAVAPQSSNLRELAPVLNTPGKILRVDPELGPVREKRYLPGDIRYKPEPGKALPEKKVANGRVHPDVSALAKQRKDVVGKSVASSSKGISEKMNGSRKPPQPEFKVPSSSKLPPKRKTEAELRAEMELRKREAKLLERELEERRVREEQRKAEISINKLKREEMRRFEQKKQLMMNRRGRDHDREREHRKTGPSRFANFKYDSEMDDFIDDTELDDLQRKDIEETLRLINPRYDKKKWKMREMMIDDRRMDARFRDIETEERHSTRMGLIEDLKEAKKGSKSIG